jgi:uridine kinase/predicted membrane protein
MKNIKLFLKNLTLSAMFTAMGLLLPFLTGQIPEIGSMLLPMHIPALLCGIFCGPLWGGAVGFIMPLLRSAVFGMPPLFPTATAMAFELAAYAAIIGVCYRVFRKTLFGLYSSLIIAMLGGRAVWGIVTAILLNGTGKAFTFAAFIAGGFTNAVPGIILQLFLIPLIVAPVSKMFGQKDNDSEIERVIKDQIRLYPGAQAVDLLKVIYQNEFGPGHLITDKAKAEKLLADEIERAGVTPFGAVSDSAEMHQGTEAPENSENLSAAEKTAEDVFEFIGNRLCRLNVRAIERPGLSPETFYRFFELTAIHTRGSEESFLRKVRVLKKMCGKKGFPATAAEIDAAVSMWQAGGGGLFSHSESFKTAYKPAYRVVEEQFCRYLDVFSAIDKKLTEKTSPVIIAIDGRSGSGKTTLAALIAEVLGGVIIPADHFFLRPEQKTPERENEPGGNIDYERFEEEIIMPLKAGGEFSYKPYDCASGDFGAEINVPADKLYIVEGTYSASPRFADIYDLRVFLSVKPDEQLRRIKIRNPETAERFKNEWIPKEEKYFEMLNVFSESVDKFVLK